LPTEDKGRHLKRKINFIKTQRSGEMKKSLLVFLVLLVFGFAATSWGQCPEENDYGECDTIYVEPWPDDVQYEGKEGPYFVRVPVYITHDHLDYEDSLASFIIPLTFTTSRPSLWCSLGAHWNTNSTLPFFPDFAERSVFRHLIKGNDTTFNWMASVAIDNMTPTGMDWDTRYVDIYPPDTCFVGLFPTGSSDIRFGPGSRVLLYTMTLRMEDTMTVCFDTAFWEPASQLQFVNDGHSASAYVPRPGNSVGVDTYTWCFGFEPGGDVKEIETSDQNKPTEFSLSQNYPNPFNPVTNFRFTLAKTSHVRIEIYNIVGQRVRTLVDEEMSPGVYLADWDSKDDKGSSVSSGVYFYRMTAGDFSDMKKMLLVK
jgi:hypothetical protein